MHDYTPNPANNPSVIPELDDGDTPDVSSINPSIEALADKIAHALVGGGTIFDMQALTAPGEGERFIVNGNGVYFYDSADPHTPDGAWIVAATGAGVGNWVYELFGFGLLARVGPVPGESSPAASGRLRKSVVDHGYFTHNINTGATYDTTSTGLDTLVQQDISDLQVGDIVECHINAVGHCTSHYQVGTYASQDGGSYVLKTPVTLGSPDPAYQPGGTGEQTLALSFFATVTTAGTYSIRIRGMTGSGSATLRVTVGSWLIRVTRP